jgi:hypothetical protein
MAIVDRQQDSAAQIPHGVAAGRDGPLHFRARGAARRRRTPDFPPNRC